ncbi:MAG: hypothetical protein ACYS9C_09910 [Planctomycetota bacterium]
MTRQKIFWMVLILASACELFAAPDPNICEQLNLSSTHIAGSTVYCEKSLEEKLPAFENLYKEYRNQIHRQNRILVDEEKIIAEINSILGLSEIDLQKLFKSMAGITNVLLLESQAFYLVKKETAKDYLRKGGKLPRTSYDKETDMVSYYFGIVGQSMDSKVTVTDYFSDGEELEVLIPVDSEETFEKDVREYLKLFLGSLRRGAFLHEVIESAILRRWKPQDPYWRWFSDGFANAITIEMLKKYAGREDAEELVKAYDVNEYKELEKEINLRYWMGLNFCIKTPLEYENQLRMARYTYATYEARKLMEKHRIGCVRKILDKACEKEPRNSENLLVAIKEVTGEDMEARLARYQTFESRKEGVAKYLKLFKAATSKTDLEQTLINLLRVLELRENLYSPTSLRERQIACSTLFQLGHEKAADEGIQQCLKIFKQTGVPEAYKAALERFLAYHLDCDKPEKALAEAEEILKDKPEHILALVVKMLTMDRLGKKTEAKETAKKILSLEKDEQSTVYEAAAEILTANPNQ